MVGFQPSLIFFSFFFLTIPLISSKWITTAIDECWETGKWGKEAHDMTTKLSKSIPDQVCSIFCGTCLLVRCTGGVRIISPTVIGVLESAHTSCLPDPPPPARYGKGKTIRGIMTEAQMASLDRKRVERTEQLR
ncbi:hypothetical protein BGX38DRAFT_370749 [Terfezia claveryi]|nr:hypothetical protein BGX38DRAFT_370749 [Terfezia claveryi]